MRSLHAAGLVMFAALAAAPAVAQPSAGGICGRPEILDLAARHFGRRTAHLELVANSAIEIRTTGERVVCAVAVRVSLYDLVPQRAYPTIFAEQRYFEVRRLHDGLEVDFGGD